MLLCPNAARDSDALRRQNREKTDIRGEFSRDADRILHSHAYTRYIDKTQVFSFVRNDHITHRVLHVQLVSKIARTIGRALRLNEDLIEAIALGHDIGHIPFGHSGEACLSVLSENHGIGSFRHNVQSVRFLDVIEDCDLTMPVLDGILCHNGERSEGEISPSECPDWNVFDLRMDEVISGKEEITPMTLEGCVVRAADVIAYIGRDIQDAKEVEILKRDCLLPESCRDQFGEDTRSIVHSLIMDLIEHSDTFSQPLGRISYSESCAGALADLREFNYRMIYESPPLLAEKQKIGEMFEIVFDHYLEDLEEENKESRIVTDYMNARWVKRASISSSEPAVIVRDFIAGMTDRYFMDCFSEIVLPCRVDRFYPGYQKDMNGLS